MNDVIVHAYVEPDLENLNTNENAECCNCMMAEKTQLFDGGEGYLCKAALYDIKTLSCFVPKELGDNVQTHADKIRAMYDEQLAHELSLIAGWDRTQYNKAKQIGIETVMLNWLRDTVAE